MCFVREVFEQRNAVLVQLQTGYRRRVSRCSADGLKNETTEVAIALNLTPEAVHTRHSRAMKELRSLMRGSTLSEWGDDCELPPDFPTTGDNLRISINPPRKSCKVWAFFPTL